jgi:hypothetical protein
MSEEEKTTTENKKSNFTRYLTTPLTAKSSSDLKKAIPFAPGIWDEDGFVTISEDQKKVTFELQQGNYNDHGYNGCYPVQMLSF